MLSDRVLVRLDDESAERRSVTGIVIPATAEVSRRLSWGFVVATGRLARQIEVGDKVLFDSEKRAEVELSGTIYLLLREKDVHGIAEAAEGAKEPGLYL